MAQLLKLNLQLKDGGINASLNDMIVKAVAKALRDVPEANCYFDLKVRTSGLRHPACAMVVKASDRKCSPK
jgi:pyruvate/2-oxoglutarate dehydrogenase complex dihydrolipoamide acyltransferase (E2) component